MQKCCEILEHRHQLVRWQVGVAEVNSTPFRGMENTNRVSKRKGIVEAVVPFSYVALYGRKGTLGALKGQKLKKRSYVTR